MLSLLRRLYFISRGVPLVPSVPWVPSVPAMHSPNAAAQTPMFGEHPPMFGERKAPVGEQTAPVGEQTAPVGEQTAPVGEQTAPVGERNPLVSDHFATSLRTCMNGRRKNVSFRLFRHIYKDFQERWGRIDWCRLGGRRVAGLPIAGTRDSVSPAHVAGLGCRAYRRRLAGLRSCVEKFVSSCRRDAGGTFSAICPLQARCCQNACARVLHGVA